MKVHHHTQLTLDHRTNFKVITNNEEIELGSDNKVTWLHYLNTTINNLGVGPEKTYYLFEDDDDSLIDSVDHITDVTQSLSKQYLITQVLRWGDMSDKDKVIREIRQLATVIEDQKRLGLLNDEPNDT